MAGIPAIWYRLLDNDMLIELNNISKNYLMGKVVVPALRGVNLEINTGEFIAIMGPSGSGKSTLLHILGLLDKHTGGKYKLMGREISELSDDEFAVIRNRFIGFIFQDFNLLARLNATENVALPLVYSDRAPSGETKKPVELLENIGLKNRTQHRPNEMSGGQQQRVAVARALVNNPHLILADEPTGNLDSKSAGEIMDILKKLNDTGITVIMVTHEQELAMAAKRIIRLADGSIVADEEIRKSPAVVPKIQSRIDEDLAPTGLNLFRIKNYFDQAFRSLLVNKSRSFLSILGVLIGVGSVIAMLALGAGAREDIKTRIASLGSNILMVRPSSTRMGGVAIETGTVTRLTAEDALKIKERVPGVSKVASYVSGRGQVVHKNKNWNTIVIGTTYEYPAMRASQPAEGRFFTETETITRAKVAVIGTKVATELFGNTNPLGEFIKIKRIEFLVIGVMPQKGSSPWRDENDQVFIPLNTAMYRLLGKDYIDYLDVQVADNKIMEETGEKIKELIINLHRLKKETANIDIRNLSDIQETISATAKTFSWLLGSIAFISLLVGGIGIMNIMLVSVTERTREIGLRKAIGANKKDILFQFIIEAIVICLVGGIIGILLGTVATISITKFAGWAMKLSFFSVLLSILFAFIVGLTFGFLPARKASLLSPIEALRYE